VAAVETPKRAGQHDCHQQATSAENGDAAIVMKVELSHAAHEQVRLPDSACPIAR
jgi:hypothetical protein